MSLTVVTSFSPEGYKEYGQKFIETFSKFWPEDVELAVYADMIPVSFGNMSAHRITVRPLQYLHKRQVFMGRYGNSPAANGRRDHPCWKDKDRRDGYSFRTDAVKFCNKVFALDDAAQHAKGDLLWIDADVKTLRPVSMEEITAIWGDADVAYLGRDAGTSECGFIFYRMPKAQKMISEVARWYSSGDVFDMREWHDSYVWDRTRVMLSELNFRNISHPDHRKGHAWVHSPLGAFMDHMKGDRKALGASPEMKDRA